MMLTILHKRAWTVTGKDNVERSGNTYGARKPDGSGVTFTSSKEYEKGDKVEVELVELWDEQKSKIKYQEKKED